MKKTLKLIPIFLFLFFFMVILAIPVSQKTAQAATEEEKAFEQTIIELLDELNLTEYEKFVEELDRLNENHTLQSLIKDVLSNNTTEWDFEFFLNYILSILLGNIQSALAQCLIIVIVCVLLSILRNLNSEFNKKSVSKIIFIACYAVVIAIVVHMVSSSIIATQNTINSINSFVNVSFPIFLTLITALGATTSAAIFQPITLIFSTVIINIINYVVIPIFYFCFVFNVIGNLSSDLKLEKLSKSAKSLGDWILGGVFGIFITYATTKGITGASFDTLATRSTKYALSNYVPIVGDYIKDGFDLVTASCVVIKNALGYVSVFLLLMIIVVPIIKVLVTVFTLRLTASICEPIGDTQISSMLFGISKTMNTLVAIMAAMGFCILIIIMLIMATCNLGLL